MINPVISEQSELAMKEQGMKDTTVQSTVYKVIQRAIGLDLLEKEILQQTQKASTLQQQNTPMTAIALQQLLDASISLYKAYYLGIDIDVAENDLIAVIEQYNAIHGI